MAREAPGFHGDDIEAETDALIELRDEPAGTLPIACGASVLVSGGCGDGICPREEDRFLR